MKFCDHIFCKLFHIHMTRCALLPFRISLDIYEYIDIFIWLIYPFICLNGLWPVINHFPSLIIPRTLFWNQMKTKETIWKHFVLDPYAISFGCKSNPKIWRKLCNVKSGLKNESIPMKPNGISFGGKSNPNMLRKLCNVKSGKKMNPFPWNKTEYHLVTNQTQTCEENFIMLNFEWEMNPFPWNQMKFRSDNNQELNCQYDRIPLNFKGIGILFLSVQLGK